MGFLTAMMAILLLVAGLIIPLRWLLRVWMDERAVGAPLAIGALFAHVAIFMTLTFFFTLGAVIYSGLILLLIGASPYLTGRLYRRAATRMAEEDIVKYQRLLQRDPNHTAAHAALGDAYLTCARYDEAIAEYERALELDPHYCRGEIPKLRRARRMKEANER